MGGGFLTVIFQNGNHIVQRLADRGHFKARLISLRRKTLHKRYMKKVKF